MNWQQTYVEAYASDADRALQRFINGERDAAFMYHVLQLVRTYLSIPLHHRKYGAADLAIARLAASTHQHLHAFGYWHDTIACWPELSTLARRHNDAWLYTELVKQLAIIHNNRGDSAVTYKLYTDLIADPLFAQSPAELQLDVLHQFGTMLVWQGDLQRAQQVLGQVLTMVALDPTDPYWCNPADLYGVRSSFQLTPLWESSAYTLNQLGNIALFRGKFGEAEVLFRGCLAILLQHDQAENLACVAYQASGRLLTHWQQPAKALPLLEHGIAIRQWRQDENGVAINRIYLADALLQQGASRHTELLLNQALPTLQANGDRRNIGLCYLSFGELAWLQGNGLAATVQWQQAFDYLETVHMPLVEQAAFFRHLLSLCGRIESMLFRRGVRQFMRTVYQQKLSFFDLWRLWRVGCLMQR